MKQPRVRKEDLERLAMGIAHRSSEIFQENDERRERAIKDSSMIFGGDKDLVCNHRRVDEAAEKLGLPIPTIPEEYGAIIDKARRQGVY